MVVTAEKGEVALADLLDLHDDVTDQFVAQKLTSDLTNAALRFAISESKESLPPQRQTLGSMFHPTHIFDAIQTLRYSPTNTILKDFEGVFRPGQMLRMSNKCCASPYCEGTYKYPSRPWQAGFRLYRSPQDPR